MENDLGAKLRVMAERIEDESRAKAALRDAVTEAHDAGASWSQIAEYFGVSRQAVWEKFGKPVSRSRNQ